MPTCKYIPIATESAVCDDLCQHLFTLATSMDSIVEIGCFFGKSTHALLSGCKGTVYAVDHFKGSLDKGDATFGRSGKEEFLCNCGKFPNLVLMEMYSHEAAAKFEDNSVDMVFIDAGHSEAEVTKDLQCWYPKCKKVICGHDYGMDTVQAALTKFGIALETFSTNYWQHFKDAK